MCGENRPGRVHVDDLGGSSPRVRGKHHRRRRDPHRWRLIPACAGKTGPAPVACSAARAHPRVCGENFLSWAPRTALMGSSPRVRGKPGQVLHGGAHVRLIPACAGKTGLRSALRKPARAHPRVCGENETAGPFSQQVTGSSPRVRGKLASHRVGVESPGLIPACAGKTWGSRPTTPKESGSSPRVRGKHGHQTRAVEAHGLIPACAGKTTRARP